MSQTPQEENQFRQYEQRIRELEREIAQRERRERRERREKQQTPVKQQPSTRKKTFRIIRNVCIVAILLVLIIGSFVLGRLSLRPRFNSYVPKFSSSPQEPPKSPDEVLQQLFTAAQQQDDQQILSLLHPDYLDRNDRKIANLMKEWPGKAINVTEIKVIGVEESAKINFSLVHKNGVIAPKKIVIKKHQGQWLITTLPYL